jgi:DNA primase
LLGTSITKERLTWLAKRFKRIVVWLDRDKLREARDISDAARLLGVESCTVFTEHDPKDYSLEEIKEKLT